MPYFATDKPDMYMKEYRMYLFLLATAPHSSLLASIVAFYGTTASRPGGGTSEGGDINIRERLGGREGGREGEEKAKVKKEEQSLRSMVVVDKLWTFVSKAKVTGLTKYM